MAEPKLFWLARNPQREFSGDVNHRFRWFRLRSAAREEIDVGPYETRSGWRGYVACDGSGSYNYAFGPPFKKSSGKRRTQCDGKPGASESGLAVSGELINRASILELLNSLSSRCDGIIITLASFSLGATDVRQIIKETEFLDTTDLANEWPNLFLEKGMCWGCELKEKQ